MTLVPRELASSPPDDEPGDRRDLTLARPTDSTATLETARPRNENTKNALRTRGTSEDDA